MVAEFTYLDLPSTLYPVDAWCKFEKFVEGAGWDAENLSNVRHLFDVWSNLDRNEHGVRFTRGIIKAQKYSLVRDLRSRELISHFHDNLPWANLGNIRRRGHDTKVN